MTNVPLAESLRPKILKDFVGQEHLTGKDGVITKLLTNQKPSNEVATFPSLIFWGPPGCGKTTLARIIANTLDRMFYEFSAVNTSSKEIDNIITTLKIQLKDTKNQKQLTLQGSTLHGVKTSFKGLPLKGAPIIFLDEIHRFNKAQQDRLLPHVEKGTIILIGATTENPSFEVIGPLLSRCKVITLNQLGYNELSKIASKGLKKLKVKIDRRARNFLIESSNGDARALINTLEIASKLSSHTERSRNGNVASFRDRIETKTIETALQRSYLAFDKKGEEHYNVISAFIKSMRASNVDASLYYLARMVEAGQDPLYIARRMVVFASEDVGMAVPTALVVANEVFRACETIGYPECAINLAHGVTYLAKATKNRSAYDAYFAAVADVKKYGNLPVPLEIRNAPTKLMKELGYGKRYEKYTKKSLLQDKIKGRKYYQDNN